MESKEELHDSTLEAVQRLIQANLDSADGFDEAVRRIDHIQVASLLSELEAERRRFASTLQRYVGNNGERPCREGTWWGTLQRSWLDFRSTLSDGDPRVILAEAVRSESHLKETYEAVLRETAGSAMNDVLSRQYVAINAGHDRISQISQRAENL